MTVATALLRGQRLFEEGAVSVPRLTAEVLLCHVLGRERAYLYAHPEKDLEPGEETRYERALQERLNGRPTQYITGRQEFYGREFRVTPAVMIPRPETEHVVEEALALLSPGNTVVDACCGSGNIAVTLSLESECRVLGTDVSREALEVAAANARRLGARVELIACDLVEALGGRSVHLLVCNPPYVPKREAGGLSREVREHEPHLALFGGESGLDVYRRLITQAERVLKPGGWLALELGIRQLHAVKDMLVHGWDSTRVREDLAGLPRVLAARYRR